jgi:hypothetical protein
MQRHQRGVAPNAERPRRETEDKPKASANDHGRDGEYSGNPTERNG